ncbi:MAG TPA: PEP-CTERM sorting domain-containing protein [Nitrospiraceae bacterium]|nr:PEP-CTERM sorting domain-containing protein [Nitrospiraceae bacterium]
MLFMRSFLHTMLLVLTSGLTATVAHAIPTFTVSFNDPAGAHSSFYDPIEDNLIAAASDWGQHLPGSPNVAMQVNFTNEPTTSGSSVTSSFVRTVSGINVFEQGVAAKLGGASTTVVPGPDAVVNIGTNYLRNELWFDPLPFDRGVAAVPFNKTDAYSSFLHEFGHIVAFNGWKDPMTGLLPGDFQSTFDEQTSFIGGRPFFVGSNAMEIYGGAVPLSMNAGPGHLGNPFPGPGSELINDAMTGIAFFRGYRYTLSPLDLAILEDVGIALVQDGEMTVVPEPSTVLLLCSGLFLIIWRKKIGTDSRLKTRRQAGLISSSSLYSSNGHPGPKSQRIR